MIYISRERNSKDNIITESSRALNFFYNTFVGRVLLKIVICKFVSNIIGSYMNSKLSKKRINKFVEKNDINTFEYEAKNYKSYNDFFTRKVIEYKRPIKFDDIMQIKLWVSKYTGVSFEIEYEIINKETQELCIVAHSKSCFVKNNRVVSIKRECPDIDQKLRENLA